jgi:hypothetical protein
VFDSGATSRNTGDEGAVILMKIAIAIQVVCDGVFGYEDMDPQFKYGLFIAPTSGNTRIAPVDIHIN